MALWGEPWLPEEPRPWLHAARSSGTLRVRPRGPELVHYYSAPWEVVEGDVAGCGPRLFLTGTKLLSGVWDRLVGEARQNAFNAADQVDAVTWLVLEHGLRVLAPVSLRERLVCLLALDELADSSSLRLYYRIMRSNGEPVACAAVGSG